MVPILKKYRKPKIEKRISYYYSDLKLSTGFALAALKVWDSMVESPRNKIIERLRRISTTPICTL